jgi:hypothetical protein
MQQRPFVDLYEEEESEVLNGLLMLNNVTSTQLADSTQEIMINQNQLNTACEFDLLEDPEGIINEGRINSTITAATNKRWYREYALYIGVNDPENLSSEDFADVKVANFMKKTGESQGWVPHCRKKILAAFNGFFRICIPPRTNICKHPEDWPRTTRVLMVKIYFI